MNERMRGSKLHFTDEKDDNILLCEYLAFGSSRNLSFPIMFVGQEKTA